MSEWLELIPGLPEELALECLTRLRYTAHGVASSVCRRWQELLQSREFYYHRKQAGQTHKSACLVQAIPTTNSSEDNKRVGPPRYAISVFDPVARTWDRIEPIPEYPDGLPLFCELLSTEGKLVMMGGWDPTSYDPVKDVFVYEFTTRRWKRGKDLPEKRTFFAAGELNGRIVVAGGHDENKNALSSAWAYDVRNDEWEELNRMSQERDECEGVVIGSELWVISGYRTESQGNFEGSAEVLDSETGEWRRVEDAWGTTQCPRKAVGVGKDGKLFCWTETESEEIRVGACAVELGDRVFRTGSAYQGAPHGFVLVDRTRLGKKGQKGKMEKLNVPDDFMGFVQSGCCAEI